MTIKHLSFNDTNMTHECLCMHNLAFPLPEASWSFDPRRRIIFLLTTQRSIAKFTNTGDVLTLGTIHTIRDQRFSYIDTCDSRQSSRRLSPGIVMGCWRANRNIGRTCACQDEMTQVAISDKVPPHVCLSSRPHSDGWRRLLSSPDGAW